MPTRDPATVAAVVFLSLLGGLCGGIGAVLGATGGIVFGALVIGGVTAASLLVADRRARRT